VKATRTVVEMALVNARQRKLGFQAQNRCIEVIALTEKKIRGQEAGLLLKAHDLNRRHPDRGADRHHEKDTATIAELGLTKQQNRDFKDMAPVPDEIIHQVVEAANAEGKVVSKAEIKRAAGVKFHNDAKSRPKVELARLKGQKPR
jgi:hypothetical protein